MKSWLTRTILILSLVSLFNDVAGELLYPVLPLYMAGIGYGAVWIGILEGCAEAIAGLTKGWFGELSDRRGTRLPFIRLGYLISAFSKPLLAVFASAPWALLMRSSDRLGKGVRTGARDALLSDEAGKEHKGKVFGFHRAMDTLGAVIGPVIALLWLTFHRNENYKTLFYYALIPGLICFFLLFLVKEKKKDKKATTFPRSPFSSFSYWKRANKEYRKLVGGIIVFTLFNSSDMFLLLMIKIIFKNGLQLPQTGFVVSGDMMVVLFYIFYNIIYAVSSYPAGALADKFGPKLMMIIGYSCFALTYGGMAVAASGYTSSPAFVVSCFVIYGFYAACTDGISKAWISQLCEKEDKGLALGLFSGFQSFATLGASVAAGLIWTFFHPAFVFLSAALASGIIVFYLTFALKSTRIERSA